VEGAAAAKSFDMRLICCHAVCCVLGVVRLLTASVGVQEVEAGGRRACPRSVYICWRVLTARLQQNVWQNRAKEGGPVSEQHTVGQRQKVANTLRNSFPS